MELIHFIRVLRRGWRIVLGGVALGAVVAGALVWTQAPVYTTQAKLFATATGARGDLSQTYEGGVFARRRVLSYVHLALSAAVMTPVIERLELPETVEQLRAKITAAVPRDTVLIDLTVMDPSPARAQAIAGALAAELSRFVNRLESGARLQSAPVVLRVIGHPQRPATPVTPRKLPALAMGVLLGLALGLAAAVARDRLDARIAGDADVSARAAAPVLG